MLIKALKEYPYAQVNRRKDDVFEAEERDARILIAAGVAEQHRAESARSEVGRRTRYRRRDMRAEECESEP